MAPSSCGRGGGMRMHSASYHNHDFLPSFPSSSLLCLQTFSQPKPHEGASTNPDQARGMGEITFAFIVEKI